MIGSWLSRALSGLVPSPVAGVSATEALRRVAGYSGRQGASSVAIIGALGGLAWQQQAYEWLGLYCLLLAPLLAVGLAAHASRLLPRLGWTPTWCIVLAPIAASAFLALPAYRDWAGMHEFAGLRDNQVLACVIGFGLLTLALPLWQLQSQSAALRLATLEQAAVTAELKALQAQIEPHFLYNTLANTRYRGCRRTVLTRGWPQPTAHRVTAGQFAYPVRANRTAGRQIVPHMAVSMQIRALSRASALEML